MVGDNETFDVGDFVVNIMDGEWVGSSVYAARDEADDGLIVGTSVKEAVGKEVGAALDGDFVGVLDGPAVGIMVGRTVDEPVGTDVGADVGVFGCDGDLVEYMTGGIDGETVGDALSLR